MISDFPSVVIKHLGHFSIASGTAVSVRIDDRQTKRFKKVKIEREYGPVVVVTLNDFVGDKFKVTISLSSGKVALLFPELADKKDGRAVLLEVIKSIENVFAPPTQ